VTIETGHAFLGVMTAAPVGHHGRLISIMTIDAALLEFGKLLSEGAGRYPGKQQH